MTSLPGAFARPFAFAVAVALALALALAVLAAAFPFALAAAAPFAPDDAPRNSDVGGEAAATGNGAGGAGVARALRAGGACGLPTVGRRFPASLTATAGAAASSTCVCSRIDRRGSACTAGWDGASTSIPSLALAAPLRAAASSAAFSVWATLIAWRMKRPAAAMLTRTRGPMPSPRRPIDPPGGAPRPPPASRPANADIATGAFFARPARATSPRSGHPSRRADVRAAGVALVVTRVVASCWRSCVRTASCFGLCGLASLWRLPRFLLSASVGRWRCLWLSLGLLELKQGLDVGLRHLWRGSMGRGAQDGQSARQHVAHTHPALQECGKRFWSTIKAAVDLNRPRGLPPSFTHTLDGLQYEEVRVGSAMDDAADSDSENK